jgi:hypothetical protein
MDTKTKGHSRSAWPDLAGWILFAILAFFLPGIAQLSSGIPALRDHNGEAFFAILLSPLAGYIPAYLSPNRRVGAVLLILSIIALSASSMEMSTNVPSRCWLVHFYTDIAVILGAVFAA